MSLKVKYIAYLSVVLALTGCGGKDAGNSANGGVSLSERESFRYEQALQAVERVESLCDQIESAPAQESIKTLVSQANGLKYDYNDAGMNQATIAHCDSLKARVERCKSRAEAAVGGKKATSTGVRLVGESDRLLTESKSYPIYLNKGETLVYDVKTEDAVVKLYNADTERLLKSYSASEVSDSLSVPNSGIYQIIITPNGKQYVSVALNVSPGTSGKTEGRPRIKSEQVECKKGDIGAVGIDGITMRKCFEEPRKFTLRGQLKAAFSGSAKALVPVQVPAGATDILYSLRIATSEASRNEDGKFHDNLLRSYTRVKFLGLPLYEKNRGKSSGLLSSLLDGNRPVREEDAYCSMFVFRNQAQAKQFQDGTKATSSLSYDVDYSTIGTQSCNGRIPTNGRKTIYLGFENERMRYTNYIWVEVEAVIPQTVYYKTKHSI